MTSVAPEHARPTVPPLQREQRVVAGVAAGLAAALAVDPVVVRIAFVVLAAAGGLGVLLYVVAWGVMAAWGGPPLRTVPRVEGLGSVERLLGVMLVTVGLLLLVQGLDLGFARRTSWPVVLVGIGLLLAWHRGRLGAFVDGGSGTAARVVAGLVLAGAGLAGLIALNLDVAAARDALLVLAAVVGGVALIVAPAIVGLGRELAAERRQRIRTEERERMAAHLHDSVLQTLALIQRDADEPSRTRALARGQERELRAWLFGGEADGDPATIRAGLERDCVEVERLHDVPVELVVVGAERAIDPRSREVLSAAREAIVNAAKHSAAARIDVYAELDGETLHVFVRDTGNGFDPDAVAADRRGLRESVIARLQRVGGTATVTSAPGEGTEVELRLPLERER